MATDETLKMKNPSQLFVSLNSTAKTGRIKLKTTRPPPPLLLVLNIGPPPPSVYCPHISAQNYPHVQAELSTSKELWWRSACTHTPKTTSKVYKVHKFLISPSHDVGWGGGGRPAGGRTLLFPHVVLAVPVGLFLEASARVIPAAVPRTRTQPHPPLILPHPFHPWTKATTFSGVVVNEAVCLLSLKIKLTFFFSRSLSNSYRLIRCSSKNLYTLD